MRTILPVLIVALVFSCKSPGTGKKTGGAGETAKTEIKGSFSISGAYALYPLISNLADDFMRIQPGVRIEVTRMGTGEGITALLSKKCQIAMISRPLTNEEINEGIWVIPVAKDGVAPIVNQRNPFIEQLLNQGLSPQEFLQVFTSGKELTWGFALGTKAKEKINVYVRNDESGAADIFADFIYKKASDLKGIGVTGDDEMIRSIQEDPLGIGFCNFTYAFDVITGERKKDIQIIPSDLDFDNKIDKVEVPFTNLEAAHRSLWLGFYPDQLCRELTLGCLGKPTDPAVVAFLHYVLGEGQANVKKSGYCPLNNVYINYSLELLK
ncbi:MAG: substrate-binding domain-containing protein [Bacteroidota bacterium]|nr:substrate-binding domain-containing protein [Bacteroidota bacterium]